MMQKSVRIASIEMQGHFLQFKINSNVFVMLNIHIKLTWLLNTKKDTGMIIWTLVKIWTSEKDLIS